MAKPKLQEFSVLVYQDPISITLTAESKEDAIRKAKDDMFQEYGKESRDYFYSIDRE